MCLAREASLHFLSGALALHAAPLPDRALTINQDDLHTAREHLQQVLGLDVAGLFADHSPRSACKKLRQCMADALGRELRRQAPWLQPPGWFANPPPNPARLHCLFATSWMPIHPRLLLFGGPFRLATAMHCGLPVFGPSHHCQYTPASTGRPCSHPLGRFSHHVLTCAFAPRMHRHNALRDAWGALFHQAGWTVRTEQLVPTRDDFKRADLSATSPAGEDVAVDVMVTSPSDLSVRSHDHLHAQALAKASRYGCGPGGLLPNGTRFVPLIHSGVVPFLDHYAMELFTRLCRQAGLRKDPASPAYWHPSLHDWTCAAAAQFTVAAARAAYRMHSSCGPLVFM